MKVRQVCKIEDCDKKPETVKVGGMEHTFCCMKGFEKSLEDFRKAMGNNGAMPFEN